MKEIKDQKILLRMTLKQRNQLRGLARLYAGGNLSLWLVFNGLNAPRRYLTKADLEKRTAKKTLGRSRR